jgi:cell wall assembly regulator SMI1
MKNSPVENAWETIEAELATQFPSVSASLNPPASEIDVARLEKRCDVSLPDDFKVSLLRHNGQKQRGILDTGFVNSALLLNVDSMITIWTTWRKLAADPAYVVHPDNDTSKEIATNHVWHPKWIPFTETVDGNSHIIDLAPRKSGTVGQVFMHAHGECGNVMTRSFTQWLERVASKLKNREYDSELVARFNAPWFSDIDI